MVRPLYKELAHASLQRGSGHAGLWYDKFCDRWEDDWKLPGDKKLEWIETVTTQSVESKPLPDEAVTRLLRLVNTRSGRFGVFISTSRFVTGLGRSHPVENGFAWHPTLGVPYLPGSSVKGIVRHWAETVNNPELAERMGKLFGAPGTAGDIVFLDALPVAPVKLATDVITPHFSAWSAEEPPGDWNGPVPIPFLVMNAKSSFAFSVLPVRPNNRSAVDDVWSWLREALELAGAGAKTAVGYGRFRFDERATEGLQRQLIKKEQARQADADRREALRTPEGRWASALGGKKEREILELVRLHLEKEPLSDPVERRAFAGAVNATELPKLWSKGQKQEGETQVGEKKLKERAKLVRQAAADDDKRR